jgi:glycosyltransferase involved in cell wall biosynthesis
LTIPLDMLQKSRWTPRPTSFENAGERLVPSPPDARSSTLTRICVVIPAYNEGRSIDRVVRRVRQSLPDAHILVVNDGSTDDTAKMAERAGAFVMSLTVNLGIGGAVQAGFRYAQKYDFDIAIQVDGDDQHDPAELDRLMQPVLTGRADMTVGSRWLGRGHYDAPTARRLGMRLLSALVRLRTHVTFTDTTSGFRCIARSGIELFADTYPPDFPEVEALVLACNRGLRIAEVPVAMAQRSHGRSSIAGARSAYYMTRVTLSLLLGGLSGRQRRPAEGAL